MKKLFLGAFLAISALSFAQKVQFGAKAGINIASQSGDVDPLDKKSRFGFHAGVFANAPISEKFSIQPEVIYNQAGVKVDGYGVDMTYKVDYISIPVFAQFHAAENFYVEAGPQFSFKMSAKYKAEGGGATLKGDIDDIGVGSVKSFDFAIGIGAGYYFTKNIGVSARYTAGLTKVYESKVGDSDEKNNIFQLGINYKF